MLIAGSCGDSVVGAGRTDWKHTVSREGCMQAVPTNGDRRGTDDSAAVERHSYSRVVC